eukprot:scaffold21083_cov65-Phaeocystis_antarctica.AAC.5
MRARSAARAVGVGVAAVARSADFIPAVRARSAPRVAGVGRAAADGSRRLSWPRSGGGVAKG